MERQFANVRILKVCCVRTRMFSIIYPGGSIKQVTQKAYVSQEGLRDHMGDMTVKYVTDVYMMCGV